MEAKILENANSAEIAYWNGAAGQSWVRRQATWDIVLSPVSDAIVEAARPRVGETVIDIGCGCGATTMLLADMVGQSGRVLGIDVSVPMLEQAKARVPSHLPIEFILADAATYDFGSTKADLLFSRFGVMFFADPVTAFRNLRTGLRSGGRLAFSCFRASDDNPWMMVPLKAAYRHVPPLPKLAPEAPGPFSFADRNRVEHVLTEAGFKDIAISRFDLNFDLSAGRGLDEAVQSTLEIGATSRAIRDHAPAIREAVAQSVRATLAAYQRGQSVLLPAAIWIVTARN